MPAAVSGVRRCWRKNCVIFCPGSISLTYSEALVRVYNRHGRRDNAYKSRIKILLKALGSAGVFAPG